MVDYRIHTFLALYEALNYRRTAEQLRLSQPAVSQQIHALESEYGCRLFLYDGKRLHRTAQADRLAEYARSALYNDQRLRQELAAPAVREVRVGATKTIGEFVLAGPLSRYIRDTRDNVTIEVDNTEVLLHQLEHEALDFAFVEGAFDKNRYGYRLYRKVPFVGMCRRDHPFAGRTVTLQDLRGQSVVLREKGSGTRAILENALAEYGFGVDLFSREIRSSNFSLILRFVSEGSGITFAYAPVAEGRKDIAFFHLDCLGEEREFHIVYLKGTKVFPLIRGVLGEDAPDLGEP